jgi:hypothetical protein
VFVFVIFWQKNIGKEASYKMLVKLTRVVNFTNILKVTFCTKVFFLAFRCLQFGFVIFGSMEKLIVKFLGNLQMELEASVLL